MGSYPQTITGSMSGATATCMYKETVSYEADNTAEELTLLNARGSVFGGFLVGETLSAGAWSGTLVERRFGNGEELPKRNNPLLVILQLLTSTGTQAANGRYDTLPEGWGLGIDEDLIDISGIEDLMNTIFSQSEIAFCLHEPTSFKEWAEESMFRYLQVFPFETVDGKISLSYLWTDAEARADDDGSYTEIDTDVINGRALPAWNSGSPPITSIKVQYNKLPLDDEYLSTLKINFERGKRLYKKFGRVIELKADTLYMKDGDLIRLSPNNPELPDMISRLINPMYGRHANYPAPIIELDVSYENMTIDIGDIVKVTHSELPNLKTGGRSFSGEYFQCIGSTPQPMSGLVKLVLWQIGVHDRKYGKISPSAMIDSVAINGGKHELDLYHSTYNANGVYDISDFSVGDEIMVMDSSWVPLAGAVPETATVETVDTVNHRLYLDATLANAPSQGDIVELATYDDNTSTRQSTIFHAADVDRVLGSADDTAFKYK
jgi:hypothetical protein